MDYIYAPWRAGYFSHKQEGCIFCSMSKQNKDEENHIFYRDEICYGVMNLYPYTPGHLLFIPHAHIDSPEKLPLDSWLHLHTIAYQAIHLLYDMRAQGINYGINIKKSAGAGIPEHLHLHILPRYHGDTNFITTLADCRIYGQDFESIFQKIKALAKIHLVGL